MKRIAIFYCKRIQDHSCIACINCFRGVMEKNGDFAQHDDDIQVISLTDCGDCPGLIIPRMKMLKKLLDDAGGVDVIHFGTCMKTAYELCNCPMDLDEMKMLIEKNFGIPVIIGTHAY